MGPDPDESRYAHSLAALERALVFGIHPSLDGVRALTEAMGRPQDAFASIQITGTNGKTSTARLAQALLQGEGLRTGLYTSPHLEDYTERIEINGKPVSEQDFAEGVEAAIETAERLRPGAQGTNDGFTEFELLTAGALWLFRTSRVDYAVLEVGMGGTWDSTSVVDPAVAVITGVGLDHTAVLGDTVEKIAAEKAGIIKPASAPVLGPGTAEVEEVFLDRAKQSDTHPRAVRSEGVPSPVDEQLTVRFLVTGHPQAPGGLTTINVRGVHGSYPSLSLSAPSYQAANVATAVAAAEAALGRALDVERARRSLLDVDIPGRFELVLDQPPIVIDGSHNPQAAFALADAVAEAWPEPERRPLIVLGVLADKDAGAIVQALAPVASGFAVCTPVSPRALPAEQLAEMVEAVTGCRPWVFTTVAAALLALTPDAAGRGGLLVTGSLTTAGEARRFLRDRMATEHP